MKKLILPIVVLALISFDTISVKLEDAERSMAINELEKTRNRLINSLEGLSDAQLNYQIGEEAWTIAECVEHLAISEISFGEVLQEALKTPADPSKRSEVKLSDEELIALIASREQKVKTSEAFEPSGKFGSHQATLEKFREKRNEHIDYLKTTEDDLRNHYSQLPYGTIDGLQVLLSLSGHTERHVKQIEEIKADPLFPKQ